MEKFSLVIKGRLADARKAIGQHGIGPDRFYRELSHTSTVLYVETTLDVLHAWYGEDIGLRLTDQGYPMGSLLYFSSLSNMEKVS